VNSFDPRGPPDIHRTTGAHTSVTSVWFHSGERQFPSSSPPILVNVSSLALPPIVSQSVSQFQDFDVTVGGREVAKRARPTFTPLSSVRPRSVKAHREAEKRARPTFTPLSSVRPRSQSHRRRLSDRGRTDKTGYVTWQSALGHKATAASFIRQPIGSPRRASSLASRRACSATLSWSAAPRYARRVR
jgi:hypothetical protein